MVNEDEIGWKGYYAEAPQAKAFCDRFGFVCMRNFLPKDELEEVQAAIDRYISEDVPCLPADNGSLPAGSAALYLDPKRPETLIRVSHIHDPVIRSFAKHDRWVGLAMALLGCEDSDDVEAWEEPEWSNEPPAAWTPELDRRTPPHQDNFAICLTPPRVVTIWLALDDMDGKSGMLRLIKRSHTKPLRDHVRHQQLGYPFSIADFGKGEGDEEESVYTMIPGDAMAYQGGLIHYSEPNKTEGMRRALAITFRAKDCTRDAEALARFHKVSAGGGPTESRI